MILALPVILIETIKKEEFTTYSERFGLSIVAYIAIFILISLGAASCWPWFTYEKNTFIHFCAQFGVVLALMGSLVGIYYLFVWIVNSIKDKILYTKNEDGRKVYRPKKEAKPNIIVEFIKAKYEKNCPRVEWFNQKS
jgi:hypothetical protein